MQHKPVCTQNNGYGELSTSPGWCSWIVIIADDWISSYTRTNARFNFYTFLYAFSLFTCISSSERYSSSSNCLECRLNLSRRFGSLCLINCAASSWKSASTSGAVPASIKKLWFYLIVAFIASFGFRFLLLKINYFPSSTAMRSEFESLFKFT